MFIDFFLSLRKQGIPVTLKEFLDFLGALEKNLTHYNVDNFYFVARTILVKDEVYLDTFDQVFSLYFQGIDKIDSNQILNIPDDWLSKNGNRLFSEEEMKRIKSLGGLEELMERMKELLKEQKERHQGGNKWIGTGGTSPFGAYGYNPEGVRIGQNESRHRRAVKVWDERNFQNLSSDVELDTRNIKMALRKLRILTRTGRDEEFDLKGTIKRTSKNAGMLDISMIPTKKNNVKVLLLMDIGGSMDDFIALCSQLFSAARYEFKHLHFFYFHNCIYEHLWQDNNRRWEERISTLDLIHTYSEDYKVIIVGDASMSPYEIFSRYGSVEHYNERTGKEWLDDITQHFNKCVWLNPVPKEEWKFTQSIGMIKKLIHNNMFPLTINGIDESIKNLKKQRQN
jgi:uncharacterized protein with von Willebrand factor type A (vWA) domain